MTYFEKDAIEVAGGVVIYLLGVFAVVAVVRVDSCPW